MLKSLGHLPFGRRASSNGNGLYSIKNSQKQTAEIKGYGLDVSLPSGYASKRFWVQRRLCHKNF